LELDGETPAQPDDAVLSDGEVVGVVASSARGFRVNANLAMAYVDVGSSSTGTNLAVLVLGEHVNATLRPLALFDPESRIPRGLKR